jgi:hypothetical protein
MPKSSKWFLPSNFPPKILYVLFVSLMRATCSAHLFLPFSVACVVPEFPSNSEACVTFHNMLSVLRWRDVRHHRLSAALHIWRCLVDPLPERAMQWQKRDPLNRETSVNIRRSTGIILNLHSRTFQELWSTFRYKWTAWQDNIYADN